MENENFTNNEDLNNNGIPDWAESFDRKAANKPLPEGEDNDFAYEYDNEESIKQYIPNFREYKWYQQPDTKKYYSYGQKLEDMVENNPDASKEVLNEVVDEDNGVSKEDVKPLLDEINQINDDNPNNDEVNNEKIEEFVKNPKIGGFLSDSLDYISKEDYDKMPIDEIEQRDAESITEGKPYMAIAEDMGLEEDDLFYFEQPDFIESLTPEQVEEVKNEPDKQKKINLLKTFSEENIGSIAVPNNVGVDNSPITSPIGKPDSFIDESISSGGISTTYPDFSEGSSSSSSNSSVSFDTNVNEKTKNNETNAGKSTPNKVEVEEESNAFESKSTNEALDDTFEKIGFMKEEPHKDIKVEKATDLPNEEFHSKDEERFDLKDLIKNSEGKNTLPFKFTFNGDEIIVSQIGTARREPLDIFLKHEPLAAKRIVEVLNQSNK